MSITALAQRLKRDRSSVKKDVDQLVAAGLLDVKEAPLPGHGRQSLSGLSLTASNYKR